MIPIFKILSPSDKSPKTFNNKPISGLMLNTFLQFLGLCQKLILKVSSVSFYAALYSLPKVISFYYILFTTSESKISFE